MDKKNLRPHEWLAMMVILSILSVLTLITRMTNNGNLPVTRDPPHYVVDPRIEVFIEGAVDRPGRFVVTRGMRVEEVLKEVTLLPEADVSKVKMKAKVRRGQHIRIPQKKKNKKEKPGS